MLFSWRSIDDQMINSWGDEDAFPAALLCLDAGPCSEPAAPMLVLFGGDKKLIRANHTCHWTNCGIMLLEWVQSSCQGETLDGSWFQPQHNVPWVLLSQSQASQCSSWMLCALPPAPLHSLPHFPHFITISLGQNPLHSTTSYCHSHPTWAVGWGQHPSSRSTAIQLLPSCIPVKPWLWMLRKVSSQWTPFVAFSAAGKERWEEFLMLLWAGFSLSRLSPPAWFSP